jgi:hypothetical protein
LNVDIVDPTSTVKELMLSPLGIVFEPLDEPDPEPDDPQAAAARLITPARATQLAARKLLLLPRCIPQTPFA